MILAVERCRRAWAATWWPPSGEIQNYPNSRNIIPDRVHFTVDIRSWDDDHALKAWDLLKKDFQAIASKHGCRIEIEETWRV